MARHVAWWAGTLLLATLAPVCGSQNLTFLQDTPATTFTDEDRKLQLDAATAVLTDENPRLSKEWKNPATGHSGSFQGLGNLRSEDGLHCRKIKFSSEADGKKNQMVFPVCLTEQGEWMFASGKKLTQVQ
jgi:hypothetical protein